MQALPTLGLVFLVVVLLGLTGCGSDGGDDTTVEPGQTSEQPGTPHLVEPTEQMIDLATQQCLDDLELDEGRIDAADPSTGAVLASAVVDCDDVR